MRPETVRVSTLCPICGTPMRSFGRGATLWKHGARYVCPQDEAETTKDERGHLHRQPNARHGAGVRVWTLDELDELAAAQGR